MCYGGFLFLCQICFVAAGHMDMVLSVACEPQSEIFLSSSQVKCRWVGLGRERVGVKSDWEIEEMSGADGKKKWVVPEKKK